MYANRVEADTVYLGIRVGLSNKTGVRPDTQGSIIQGIRVAEFAGMLNIETFMKY